MISGLRHIPIGLALACGSMACISQAGAKHVTGWASFYKSGARTANGEKYDPQGLTAAHRNLPFGTRIRVTNLKNGKWVVVRINDRGPFTHNRILDLSFGAAKVVGLDRMGIAPVSYEEVLGPAESNASP